MKKKLLLCTMLAVWMGLPVQAAEADFEFDTYDYIMTNYVGAGGDVVIPDVIQDCPAKRIAQGTFQDKDTITSITFPTVLVSMEPFSVCENDSLTKVEMFDDLVMIDSYNFYKCPNLTEVTIPGRVSFIGSDAFTWCDNLNSITFEGDVPYIEGDCFYCLGDELKFYVPDDRIEEYKAVLPEGYEILGSGANAEIYDWTEPEDKFSFDASTGKITSYDGFSTRLTIPGSIGGVPVTAIGQDAFKSHHYLCYVTIPEGVTDIEKGAFASTWNLSYAELPGTLVNIGDEAFNGYKGQEIIFPEGLETIGNKAFWGAASLRNDLYFPEGLKTIGDEAFKSVQSENLYFPESLESIGAKAFDFGGVEYIYFESKDLPEIAEDAFSSTTIANVDLNWKASKEQMIAAQDFFDSIGQETRVWRMQNPNVDYVRDGLDTYENGILTGYTGTQTHLRPWDGYDDIDVTGIGDGVFKGSTSIEYFAVPYNDLFTTIGSEAFADSSLAVVDLFDSVTTIGAGAFRNCVNMEELTVPASVTSIEAGAFEGCTGIKTLTILCSPSAIAEGAFTGCTGIEKIYVSSGASDEDMEAIKAAVDCPWYMNAVRVGAEDTNTYMTMTYEETPAADFWFDAELKSLDSYQGTEVYLVFPKEVDGTQVETVSRSILSRARSYGEMPELAVRSVVIPETVKDIAEYAFSDCPTLETVICYAPLEKLNDAVFNSCENLKEVIFVNGVREIGNLAFGACPALETVYLGEHVTNFSGSAFDGSNFTADQCIQSATIRPDMDAVLEAVKNRPAVVIEATTETDTSDTGFWDDDDWLLDDDDWLLDDDDWLLDDDASSEAVSEETYDADMEYSDDSEYYMEDSAVELPAFDAEAAKPYIGSWKIQHVSMFGQIMSPEEFGTSMEVVLNEDGTAEMIEEGEAVPVEWAVMDGKATVVFMGEIFVQLEPGEEGTMVYKMEEEGLTMEMVFTVADGSASETESGASENYFEQKYTCTSADVGGYMVEAETLGAEYSVTFHEDGSMDFVMAGADIPGLTWEACKVSTDNGEADAYQAIYFDGTEMNFVITESGFELNFFDSMMLYFEA